MEQTKFEKYIQNAGLEAKPHQTDAVAWMVEREKKDFEGVRGGIIADEMGLGKTIMMIGTMLANFQKRTLVVLPLALLKQWESEIKRTTGYTCLVYHGAAKARTTMEMLTTSSVVLTTYGEISRTDDPMTSSRIPSILHEIEWDRVIFDEAHHMRNKGSSKKKSSQKFIGGRSIKATLRWMITGTPVQNRMSDIYALFEVLGFKNTVKPDEFTDACMLRRTKEDVGIYISKKVVENVEVPWKHVKEEEMARDVHSLIPGNSSLGASTEFTDALLDSYNLQGMNNNFQIMVMLQRARQMCVYPALMGKKVEQLMEGGFMEDEDHIAREAMKCSSKLDAVCDKILERKENGNGKLVFCHYKMEIDEIHRRISHEGLDVRFIDGRTKKKERQGILTGSCDVLLLQIQTGCEGLNLQQFNEVYFVTPHWNPAVEDQAVARCHRIGQEKPVFIFKFSMIGTDEELLSKTLDNHVKGYQGAKRQLYSLKKW